MEIYSHGNKGHSHSHASCFSFLSVPIPNFVISSHSHWESHSHGHLYPTEPSEMVGHFITSSLYSSMMALHFWDEERYAVVKHHPPIEHWTMHDPRDNRVFTRSSKRSANVFKQHVNCWTFAGLCKCGSCRGRHAHLMLSHFRFPLLCVSLAPASPVVGTAFSVRFFLFFPLKGRSPCQSIGAGW